MKAYTLSTIEMQVLIVNAPTSSEDLFGVWRACTVSWSWVLGLGTHLGYEAHLRVICYG